MKKLEIQLHDDDLIRQSLAKHHNQEHQVLKEHLRQVSFDDI
jgi:hypothetical protein